MTNSERSAVNGIAFPPDDTRHRSHAEICHDHDDIA
jgi:hypothetical protein